jgi:hypothetical protein
MRRFCKVTTNKELTVSHVLRRLQRIKPHDFIGRMHRKFAHRSYAGNIQEAFDIIDTFRKPKTYKDYLLSIIQNGLEQTRLSMNDRKKYSRYNTKLRSVGINPEMFETMFDSEFDRHRVDLSDTFDHIFDEFDNIIFINDPLNNLFRKTYKQYYISTDLCIDM